MKLHLATVAFAVILVQCTTGELIEKPPLAEEEPVVDTYFGLEVSDPYRYMEDLEDPRVDTWFRAQEAYARKMLDRIPGRESLIEQMRKFDQRKSARITSLRISESNRYFYIKTTPEDEIGKLYYRDGYKGEEVFLFDPETYGDDEQQTYTVTGISPSDDGKLVAIEVAPNGSESSVLLTLKIAEKEFYPEVIDRCWFSAASWLPDGSGYLYNRLSSSDVHDMNRELDSKVYLHFLGNDPEADPVVFSREKYPDLGINPEDIPAVEYDKDTDLLFAFVYTVDPRLTVFTAPASSLGRGDIVWNQLFSLEDEVYDFSTNEKDLFVYTPKGAPNFKVLLTSLANPDLENAEVVVPESDGSTLTTFSLSSEGLFYTLSTNGIEEELFFIPEGSTTAEKLELPSASGVVYLRTRGYKYKDVWAGISGWTSDYRRYRYLVAEDRFLQEDLSTPVEYPEYDDLVVEELMIPSHDGVKVPLSLVYKDGLKKDGTNPVFFYGYGAYGSSMTPFFSPDLLLWTAQGGIFAIAHVRGGGELGENWHRAGFKTTKPNTWKDLIACGEFLVNNKYSSPEHLGAYSASAGGILIGRAITERPDLFAVAIPQVGAMNTLRGEETPNGPVNAPEFGTVKDSVECMALLEMDSYHHLEDGTEYPATFITAGMNDPRVIAWQPGKFAARMQALNASDEPVLFLPDYSSGHGLGDTKEQRYESMTDILAFALWKTGHPEYQLP